MAFVNQEFPVSNLRLIHGLRKSISAPTTIVGNGNTEYRIKKLKNYISSWVYPSRLLSAVDRKAIAQFYAEVAEFGLNSFKFKDPDLHTYSNTVLPHAIDGKFYLVIPGSTHPVFHLDSDVVVKKNGTVTAWDIDYVGTLPVLHISGASGTDTITISGTFFHTVRFDQASMSWSSEVLNSDNTTYGDTLGDISLIEVFEH